MAGWTQVSREVYLKAEAGETAGDRPAREFVFYPKATGS